MYPLTVFAWDARQAELNLRRNGVDFADATAALLDVRARLPGARAGGYFLLGRHDDAFILCHCRDEEMPVTRVLSATLLSRDEAARLAGRTVTPDRLREEFQCALSRSGVSAVPSP